VEYAVFGPDSSWFATASDDGLVRVFDTLSGQERFRMAHGSYVNRVRVSRDGNWLISTSYDNTTRIWDASSGVEVSQIPMKGIGVGIEFNADATRVAVGDREGNIAVWDTSYLKSRTALVKFPDYLHEIRFTPDGQWAFVNTDDKKVWQIRPDLLGSPADQREAVIPVKGLTYNMAVSDDSQWLAAVEYDSVNADYNRLVMYEIATKRSYLIPHDREVINAVAFTPDSKRVLTADDAGTVNIWDVESGEKVGSLQTEGVILSLAISPDGKYAVAGIEEGNVNIVWDMASGKQVAQIDEIGATQVVKFSPDGTWLATGGSEAAAQLWSVADGAFTRSEHVFKTTSGLQSMSFSPDGSMLAMGDAEGTAYLIDLSRMEEVARFRNINKVTGITFTPDGKQLAIAAFKTINFWEINSLHFLYTEQLTETACARQIENFSPTKWKIIFGDEEYRLICPNLPAGEN
jgi:WD40 repeat protein